MALTIEKVIRSKDLPADIHVLWLDTNTNVLKAFNVDKWEPIDIDLSKYKGKPNGLAELDENGKVKTELLDDTMIELLTYGILWDITVSNPACVRIGNPSLHRSLPILSSMRGCVHKGKKIMYYLDPNDWSKKLDGTPSDLTGADGDVGVHIMKFYGKSGADGNKRWVRICTKKIDDTWVEVPEAIVGSDKSTLDRTDPKNIRAVTVVNKTAAFRGGGNRSAYDAYADNIFKTDLGKPISAISRSTMRSYCKDEGKHLLFYEYYKWLCWLYYIEYANFNVQAPFNANLTAEGFHLGGLGSGVTYVNNWNAFNGYYSLIPCGFTNEFGNGTSIKATGAISDGSVTNNSQDVTRWRGIQDLFGDIWHNLDGIICKGFKDSEGTYHRYYYATADPSLFGDTEEALQKMKFVGEEVCANGYVGEFTLGETGEIVPADVTGSTTLKKCDYHYLDSPNVGLRAILVGGSANIGASAGLACFYSYFGVGSSSADVGFRLITLL